MCRNKKITKYKKHCIEKITESETSIHQWFIGTRIGSIAQVLFEIWFFEKYLDWRQTELIQNRCIKKHVSISPHRPYRTIQRSRKASRTFIKIWIWYLLQVTTGALIFRFLFGREEFYDRAQDVFYVWASGTISWLGVQLEWIREHGNKCFK